MTLNLSLLTANATSKNIRNIIMYFTLFSTFTHMLQVVEKDLKSFKGKGQWATYYNGPQSCLIMFFLFVGLRTLWTFNDFFSLDHLMIQLFIVIYRRGNFVYHH